MYQGQLPEFNDTYLTNFFEEKDLACKEYHVVANGLDHYLNTDVVLEHVALTQGQERAKIKSILRQIDFHNGDVHHFLEHLATAIAHQY